MAEIFKDILTKLVQDPELHTGQLYILSKMDQESLKTFQSTWPTVALERRRDIMQELVEICEVNFEVYFDPVFLLGLGDEDEQVRASAINGLWENEKPSLIAPLIHLLRTDQAAIVRATAASALGKYIYLHELEEIDRTQGLLVQNTLLETIHHSDEDIEVRRRAVEAVSFSSADGISEIIEAAYYDENERMQVSAIFAMGRNADKKWRPRAIAELDNPIQEIRFEAARACGELEAKEALPKLVELIEFDPDLEVQEMAIWAIGRIGGPLAREALEICLESDNETLALAAEEALDELNLFDGTDFDLLDFDDDDDLENDDFDNLLDLDDWNGYNDQSDYLH
jgi:HEAT repeat protein